MKKRMPSKLTVKRISTSPYFKESFEKLEKETIENLAEAEVLPFNSPKPADILITNTHTIVEKIDQQDLKECKLMIHPNSGYDNFPTDFVRNATFPIVIGNPIRAHAVTNYILSALFSHYSKIESLSCWDQSRKWPRKLLCELNILILGQGHIGTLLKGALSPLVSNLCVHDPYTNPDQDQKPNLKNIDVVILACGLNARNHHVVDKNFLQQLNKDFLLINAARGELVKAQDLITTLKEQTSAFAFLDVFETEPADFKIFSGLNNINLSSHVAGVYSNIDNATASFVANIISDFQSSDENVFNEKYKHIILKNRIHDDFLI